MEQGMVLYLHGIKNDYSRDGFCVCVCVNLASDPVICLVRTLEDYLERTNGAGQKGPVFVLLKDVYKPVMVTVILGILNKAIKLAGLDSKVYSEKKLQAYISYCSSRIRFGTGPGQSHRSMALPGDI